MHLWSRFNFYYKIIQTKKKLYAKKSIYKNINSLKTFDKLFHPGKILIL